MEGRAPPPWKKVQRQEMTMFETIPDKAQRAECEKNEEREKRKTRKNTKKEREGENLEFVEYSRKLRFILQN